MINKNESGSLRDPKASIVDGGALQKPVNQNNSINMVPNAQANLMGAIHPPKINQGAQAVLKLGQFPLQLPVNNLNPATINRTLNYPNNPVVGLTHQNKFVLPLGFQGNPGAIRINPGVIQPQTLSLLNARPIQNPLIQFPTQVNAAGLIQGSSNQPVFQNGIIPQLAPIIRLNQPIQPQGSLIPQAQGNIGLALQGRLIQPQALTLNAGQPLIIAPNQAILGQKLNLNHLNASLQLDPVKSQPKPHYKRSEEPGGRGGKSSSPITRHKSQDIQFDEEKGEKKESDYRPVEGDYLSSNSKDRQKNQKNKRKSLSDRKKGPRSQDRKQRLGEERLCSSGLLNPNFVSKEEIEKWMRARRKNYPTRKNIEAKKLREEKGEDEGELDEAELSKLELKLRKKIMILSSNPREERLKQKQMKFLFRNLTCIRKRKPKKEAPATRNNQKGDIEKPLKKLKVEVNPQKKKELKEENVLNYNLDVAQNPDNKVTEDQVSDDAPPIEVRAKREDEDTHSMKVEEIEKNEQLNQKGAEFKKKEQTELQEEITTLPCLEKETKEDSTHPEDAQQEVKDSTSKSKKTQSIESTHKKIKKNKKVKFKESAAANDKTPEKAKRKSHTSSEIIEHLRQKRLEERNLIDNFLNQKKSSDRFRYQQNTLLSSLMIDDVYKERSLILKTLRHLRNNNFLQGQ